VYNGSSIDLGLEADVMETQRRTPGVVTMVAICVVSLFYLGCGPLSGPIPTPIRTVPVSSEKAQDLVSKLGQDLILDAEGNYVLTITEEDLTSWVAVSMGETIKDPQIILSDGKIHLYGTITTPVRTTMTAVLLMEAEAGQTQTTVESITFGGFSIPETFAETLVRQIDDLVTPGHSQGEVEITEVEIAEGELTLRGRVVS
jgi:hypothetical protein